MGIRISSPSQERELCAVRQAVGLAGCVLRLHDKGTRLDNLTKPMILGL